jgi:hypothetical protein
LLQRTWRRYLREGSTLVTTRHTHTYNPNNQLVTVSYSDRTIRGVLKESVKYHALYPRMSAKSEELSCHVGPTERGGSICVEGRSTRKRIQTSTLILGPSVVGPTLHQAFYWKKWYAYASRARPFVTPLSASSFCYFRCKESFFL